MIIPTISLEKKLWKQGFLHVAGVDEAGKGPWAGPVTAGATLIHKANQVVKEIRDSKLMNRIQREKAFDAICKKSSAYGIGIVSEKEIDKLGIDEAVRIAMLQALQHLEQMLGEKLQYVIVDGARTKPLKEYTAERILDGGLYHYSIAAGSVLAKVTRDRIMQDLAKQYPHYQFEKHVGYGTKLHQQALKQYGPCPIHRYSFKPVKQLV